MDDCVERLGPSHKRDQFSCGKASLDDFLRTLAGQYDRRRLGRTYVAVKEGDQRVLGYYTLASSAVAYEHLPPESGKKLPRHPVLVILLARLAVDQTMRGQRLDEKLLVDALKRALELSESLGVHAVEVDAIDSEARNFYAKFGFTAPADRELHLYLPMETIRRSFQDV
ncbi:MAG: GNAT family N-acetyltransferase [Isosphaeraceae bacterium]